MARLREVDPQLVGAVGPPGFWPLFGLVGLTSLGPWGLDGAEILCFEK